MGIHFDVMSGNFVSNLSFGVPVLQSVRAVTHLPLDVHLMIEEPALSRIVREGGRDFDLGARGGM